MIQPVIQLVLLLFFIAMSSKQIHLATSDLGRHLANGRLLFQNPGPVFSQNFYSFTYPKFPFFNHHWGFGLVTYEVQAHLGFVGLSLFYLLLSSATFWILYRLAVRISGFAIATGLTAIALPLMVARSEVRPEGFSYLFSALFIVFLWRWREKGRIRDLVFLPLLILAWVNTHIYFFLGFVLIGAFLAEAVLQRKKKATLQLSAVLMACLLAALINPLGWRLVLYPLQIFNSYGYSVAENQPIWVLRRDGFLSNLILPFYVLNGLFAIGTLYSIFFDPKRFPLPLFLIGAAGSFMAWFAARNLSLFAFLILPGCAALWLPIFSAHWQRIRIAASLLLCVQGFYLADRILPGIYYRFGLGLEKGTDAAARFFLETKLHGPIFNNFDISGYLIYYLFPAEKVFVDNRPEAYPAEFFQKVYVPMQQNEAIWKASDAHYHFNVIFLHWQNPTPWDLAFRRARGHDPEWAPVFLDSSIVIFLRRTPENAATIALHEIKN